MYKLSDFHIGSDARWWYLRSKTGETIKKFSVRLFSLNEVKQYRLGYVRGLNDAQGT